MTADHGRACERNLRWLWSSYGERILIHNCNVLYLSVFWFQMNLQLNEPLLEALEHRKETRREQQSLGWGVSFPLLCLLWQNVFQCPWKNWQVPVEGTIATATSSIVTILRVNLFYFLIISIFVCLYLGMHISAVSHGSQKRLQIPEVGVTGSSELSDCGNWKPNSGPL